MPGTAVDARFRLLHQAVQTYATHSQGVQSLRNNLSGSHLFVKRQLQWFQCWLSSR
jgi:hypothetical protein